MIGTALGGQTQISPHQGIGIFPIELTDAGKMDPLLTGLPEKFPVMHWHGEMPGLA